MSPLVQDPGNIRLAMVGMVDGNGHPFSWSAIVNGEYDAEAMAECGYPVIPQYLGAEPKENLGISGVRVTHVWCDDHEDAAKVAQAARIPTVVRKAEDVLGQVDAVVIPTDKGWEHVDRAKAFIEAGLPVLVDKPLADNEKHLRQFARWHAEGRPFLSTSCMRYAREFTDARNRLSEAGDLRLITMTTCKSWERYGIHALEGVYPFLPPGGWLAVRNTGTEQANVVHVQHASGVDVFLAAITDLYGGFGCLGLYGTKGTLHVQFKDTFYAFKTQLAAFVEYLRTGRLPFPFAETEELMKIIIAGIRSRVEGGRRVPLAEIRTGEDAA